MQIPARDGYPLGGTVIRPDSYRGVVVINGATAVPHRFYRRFATALAEAGYSTVGYDYRGIGASRTGSLRGFEATMSDWALRDMAGVLDWAADEMNAARLLLVGHSFGGQVAGLLDRPDRVAGMATLSAQSGYWRLQGAEQKLVVAFHVHVTLPATARLLGYAPWSRVAAGEDLPRGVALQWSRWCRDRRYVLSDDSLPLDRYGEFGAPVLAFSFDDDKWGTSRSVDRMMRAYPNVERRHVVPSEVGLASIGHVGYFREASRPLWNDLVEWFDAR